MLDALGWFARQVGEEQGQGSWLVCECLVDEVLPYRAHPLRRHQLPQPFQVGVLDVARPERGPACAWSGATLSGHRFACSFSDQGWFGKFQNKIRTLSEDFWGRAKLVL